MQKLYYFTFTFSITLNTVMALVLSKHSGCIGVPHKQNIALFIVAPRWWPLYFFCTRPFFERSSLILHYIGIANFIVQHVSFFKFLYESNKIVYNHLISADNFLDIESLKNVSVFSEASLANFKLSSNLDGSIFPCA